MGRRGGGVAAGFAQALGGCGVERIALGDGKVVIDRTANEWVDERARLSRGQDLHAHQVARDDGSVRVGQPGEIGGCAQLGAAAEHGGCAGERHGVGAHPRDAARDPVGERRPGETRDRVRVIRGGVGFERAQQLLEIEGIAGAGGMAGRAQLVGRIRAAAADDLGNGRGAERGRRDAAEVRAGAQRIEQRGGSARLARPHRQEQDDREVADPAREMVERAQGRLVDPVQVVDHERQGGRGGEVRGEPVQAIEHGEACVGSITLAAVDDPGRRCGRPGEQRSALGPRDARQGGFEELADHAVGQLALELAPARRPDAQAAGPCLLARELQQRALARPCGAFDDEPAAAAFVDAVERSMDLSALGVALDDVCGGHPFPCLFSDGGSVPVR